MSAPVTGSKMYETIHRQPADLNRLLAEGWDQAQQAVDLIGTAERIVLTGIGTSYHAALVGAWLLGAAGIDARAVSSFDFARYPEHVPLGVDDAVIVMAHTGVKRFSAEAMAAAAQGGATIVSVGSLAAVHQGSLLTLRTTEREQSAAYTSSHLCAMAVLAQVATELGERREAPGIAGFREALEALPELVAGLLAREAEVAPVAAYAVDHRTYVAGAGPNEATALEAVIKVREAAYGQIDGLAAEQFLHGPMVAFNGSDLLAMVNVPGRATDRTASIAAVGAAMGGKLWIVGERIDLAAATTFALPAVPELLSPLLAVVPMQLLACQMAGLKGINPDTFRRDDERYKEAFGLVKL
ncbi:MAG: Glucosamine--fructose-6-phosphate aminotransferase [isomerizing] [uncultured Thermomicrobiales bacterium]|uniref:Glutamine--fructose-6-phosphate aminotransferase [isomerizing] n=1 Tax=uncultured Thermomicrobiales bacterium TaxID=1645740 RepID=A0A6J4U5D2_9BACT|nr:MAG: Glucosamine--fructose-6-phosphate aminotransferase [isomerizing] [uncultured Thermomicrobiales bacterium]